ncbi:MAG: hypothetical protein IPM42_03460 [Saprospiraceae bacterium]|nr:hypothetical protein [Saprospiraceae bacterium]
MKSVYFNFLLFFIGSLNAFSQVYVESTFSSINFQVSAVGKSSSSDVLFKDRIFLTGADFRISLGVSEKLGILGGFQHAVSSEQSGNQILPFTFSEKLSSSNWFCGLEYYIGSPQSKLRFKLFGQLGYSTDQLSAIYRITDAKRTLTLAGINYGGGVSMHYFLKPFLSLQLSTAYTLGKYDYSELEGRSYTEDLSNSSILFFTGLSYHFGGR